LYEVDVKKNCSARVTSSASVSMKGCRTSGVVIVGEALALLRRLRLVRASG
jgi:hypothetical protein